MVVGFGWVSRTKMDMADSITADIRLWLTELLGNSNMDAYPKESVFCIIAITVLA